jgi:transcription-repair coupling factor (superfamily II helicase)
LKENEFKDLYPEESNIETKETSKIYKLIPILNYCFRMSTSISERLSLYNELGTVKNEEELVVFQNKLIDRFGPMPPRAKALMIYRIKWIATRIGIKKLVMKQGKMIGIFSDQQSDYYQSKRFHQVLQFVQKNSSI